MEIRVIKLILFLICSLLTSCGTNELKFEHSKWNENIDGFYIYRENMLNDLLNNHL